MTSKKIKKVLSSLNYDMEKEIKLEEVSSIYLKTDGCLYPDNSTIFLFHEIGESGVLLVYRGITLSDGTFKKLLEIPSSFVDFSMIVGFTLVNSANIKQPYSIGRSV